VDFELEEDHWREIGAGRTAEVINLRAAKKANGPESACPESYRHQL